MSNQPFKFCFCGKVAKYEDKCERHVGKEQKKKIERISNFRGDSKFQKEQGMFNNKGE